MTYVITGATGHFGRHVVETLLERGVQPGEIVATGRDTSKIEDLAERGVRTRVADYDDIGTLRAAFDGADVLLLVSGTDTGTRVQQHRNAIDAANETGVGLVAYTSIANADRARMQLAADHRATERALADSGVPHLLLRNAFYLDVYTAQVPVYLQHGAVLGSADDGRISGATRADLAEGAAAALLADVPAGTVYELGGDEAFTLAELARAVSEASGREVVYRDLPVGEYARALVSAGLPEPYAAVLADADLGIAQGDLLVTSGDLSRLLGRPTTTMPEAVRAAVRAVGPAR